MSYRVVWSQAAVQMLLEIGNQKTVRQVMTRITEVAANPTELGKPLLRSLAGHWSTRAAAQRYRIIYRLDEKQRILSIVAVGIRREGDPNDIYARVQAMLHSK